jgi:hypothetical protein
MGQKVNVKIDEKTGGYVLQGPFDEKIKCIALREANSFVLQRDERHASSY